MKMNRNGTLPRRWIVYQPMGGWRRNERDYVKCSRQKAIEIGQNVYWTGKPCPHGHINFKYVNAGCIDCNAVKRRIREHSKEQDKSALLKIDRLNDKPDLEDDYGL